MLAFLLTHTIIGTLKAMEHLRINEALSRIEAPLKYSPRCRGHEKNTGMGLLFAPDSDDVLVVEKEVFLCAGMPRKLPLKHHH